MRVKADPPEDVAAAGEGTGGADRGGDGRRWGGWLRSTIVALHVDVVESQHFTPKVQTGCGFLRHVDLR